jgi:SAM-dependent methyltransferase
MQYLDIDATSIPFENYFEIIVFKSVIGEIGVLGGKDKQQTAMNEIFKALKPGGKLLFAENLAATPVHAWLRRKIIRGAYKWRYLTIREMQDFLKRYSAHEMHVTGVAAALGRTERQRNLIALMDQAVLNWVTPKSWKYIAYGIATK